jgi:hypothetical protein
MKTEVMKYQGLADSVKSFEERIAKGRTRSTYLIGASQNVQRYQHSRHVLRAVLTNSPNSCPPERLFSIFNATFDDDQKSTHADYIQLSMQAQFNKRAL